MSEQIPIAVTDQIVRQQEQINQWQQMAEKLSVCIGEQLANMEPCSCLQCVRHREILDEYKRVTATPNAPHGSCGAKTKDCEHANK